MSKASSHLGSKVCKARDVQKRQSGQAEIWWTGSFKIEGLFMQMLCVSDAEQRQFSDMLPFLQCAKWPIPGPTQSYLSVSLVQYMIHQIKRRGRRRKDLGPGGSRVWKQLVGPERLRVLAQMPFWFSQERLLKKPLR